MKKLFFMVLILTALIGIKQEIIAQGEAAVPYLLIAPDARASGMGETGTGLADGSAAMFWNPAGLAFLDGIDFSFTHSPWLPQFHLDLSYEYATFYTYLEELSGTISSSITYFNYGEFNRTGEDSPEIIGVFRSYEAALTLGYATKLSSDWGLGLNFRLFHSRLADKPTGAEKGEGVATSVSFDIGGMWRPQELDLPLIGEFGDRLSIGVNLSNIGPKIWYIDRAQADPIPTNFRLGFATKILQDEYNSLTYTLDFSKLLVTKRDTITGKQPDEFYKAIFTAWADQPFSDEIRDIVTSMGVEYWYGKPDDFMFALRAGFFYEDPGFGNRKFITLGVGARLDMYGVDFSYITTDLFKDGENHPLNNTLRFSVSVGWDKTINPKGFPRGI